MEKFEISSTTPIQLPSKHLHQVLHINLLSIVIFRAHIVNIFYLAVSNSCMSFSFSLISFRRSSCSFSHFIF